MFHAPGSEDDVQARVASGPGIGRDAVCERAEPDTSENTMHVEARMNRGPIVCHAEDTLASAAARMHDGDCGCLPVVDAEGHVLGMVTDRDICMAALVSDLPLSVLRVAQAMTRPAVTTRPLDSLEEAERTMRQHRVRRLPVVDDRARVIGMLSCHDLFRNAAANGDDSLRGSRAAVHDAVRLVATMVAIGGSPRARDGAWTNCATEHVPPRVAAPASARSEHTRDRLAARRPAPALIVDSHTRFHLDSGPRP